MKKLANCKFGPTIIHLVGQGIKKGDKVHTNKRINTTDKRRTRSFDISWECVLVAVLVGYTF